MVCYEMLLKWKILTNNCKNLLKPYETTYIYSISSISKNKNFLCFTTQLICKAKVEDTVPQ